MGIGFGRAVSLILSIPEDRRVWDARKRREGVAGPGQGAQEVTFWGGVSFVRKFVSCCEILHGFGVTGVSKLYF